MNEAEIRKRRLRGKCRRGMLELDILLQNFFAQHYDELLPAERDIFANLLELDDIVLYAWFIEDQCPDPIYHQLVSKITAH